METRKNMTEAEHWIIMNDGVRLDATTFTPEGRPPEGGWPAILFGHGHGDAGNKTATFHRARRYADHGYLTICYSLRGQGDSEGLVFHMGAREVFDLQDVITWVFSDCPCHRDKLAVVGSSQGGWHAYMAAAHHPLVATVVAENIFTQYDEFAVHKGCLAKWFFTRTMRRRILTAGLQEMARKWALDGDWFRIQEWVKPTSPMLFANRIKCPILIVHGWHDIGMPPNEVVTLFEKITAPKKLYLGGGGHDGLDSTSAQNIRNELTDRWLNHWLKKQDTGLMDEPPITYAQRPGWDHFAVATMPPKDVANQTLYLSAQTPDQETPLDPNATFSVLRPQPDRSLRVDAPDKPSIHSNLTNRPTDPGYGLKEALEDDMAGVSEALTKETISFKGTPTDAPIEIVGSPAANLYVMPNRPQIQIVVDLYDGSPDGERTLITRGQFGTRTARPGLHLCAIIEMRTIGYHLGKGHHLIFEISNYDTTYAFPYFEPFLARLYHDNRFPSALEIPVRQ